MADLVRDYISDGRKIRIIGPNGQPEVVALMKDKMAFTFDIVVDDSPNSPSMKDKTYAILQAMLPQLLQAGLPIPPEVMDYTPLPASLIEKWKETMKPNPQGDAMKQDAMMVERETKIAQIEKDKADAEYKRAQAKQVMFEITPEGLMAKANVEIAKHNAEMIVKERLGMAELAVRERLGAANAQNFERVGNGA